MFQQLSEDHQKKIFEFLKSIQIDAQMKLGLTNQIDIEALKQVYHCYQILISYQYYIAEITLILMDQGLYPISSIISKVFMNIKQIYVDIVKYTSKLYKDKSCMKLTSIKKAKQQIDIMQKRSHNLVDKNIFGGICIDKQQREYAYKSVKKKQPKSSALTMPELSHNHFKNLLLQLLNEQQKKIEFMINECEQQILNLSIFLDARQYSKYDYSGADQILRELFENLKLKQIAMNNGNIFQTDQQILFESVASPQLLKETIQSQMNSKQKKLVDKSMEFYQKKIQASKNVINAKKKSKIKQKEKEKQKQRAFRNNFYYDQSNHKMQFQKNNIPKNNQEQYKKKQNTTQNHHPSKEKQPQEKKTKKIIQKIKQFTDTAVNTDQIKPPFKIFKMQKQKQKQKQVIVQQKIVYKDRLKSSNQQTGNLQKFNKSLLNQIEDLSNEVQLKQNRIRQLQNMAAKGYYQLTQLIESPVIDEEYKKTMQQKYNQIFSNIKDIRSKVQGLKQFYIKKGRQQILKLKQKSNKSIGVDTEDKFLKTYMNNSIHRMENKLLNQDQIHKGHNLYKYTHRTKNQDKTKNKQTKIHLAITPSSITSNSLDNQDIIYPNKTTYHKTMQRLSNQFKNKQQKQVNSQIDQVSDLMQQYQQSKINEFKAMQECCDQIQSMSSQVQEEMLQQDNKKSEQKSLRIMKNKNSKRVNLANLDSKQQQHLPLQSYLQIKSIKRNQNSPRKLTILTQTQNKQINLLLKENKALKVNFKNQMNFLTDQLQKHRQRDRPLQAKIQELSKKIQQLKRQQKQKQQIIDQLSRLNIIQKSKIKRIKESNMTINKQYGVQAHSTDLTYLNPETEIYSLPKNLFNNQLLSLHNESTSENIEESLLLRVNPYITKDYLKICKNNSQIHPRLKKKLNYSTSQNKFYLQKGKQKDKFVKQIYEAFREQKKFNYSFQSFKEWHDKLQRIHFKCQQKPICEHLLRFYDRMGFSIKNNRKEYLIKKYKIDKIESI